jgi:hypothetical protein
MACFRLILLFALILGLSLAASSQPTANVPQAAVDDAFVQKAFGTTCAMVAGPPTFTADLDGDHVEDVVIAARCSNPLMDQAEHGYKVVDPYNSFYGFGDPKITTQFASEDPHGRGLSLLIIHGAGPEAWRSPAPKAKYLVINLPFKQLSLKKLTVRKKTIMAVYAQEGGEGEGTVSVVFWDGKKYRYRPLGSTME